MKQAARHDQMLRRSLDVKQTGARGHPLGVTIGDDPSAALRVLMLHDAVDHVGDRFEAAMRMPRRAFGLTRCVLHLAHLVEVDERIELSKVDVPRFSVEAVELRRELRLRQRPGLQDPLDLDAPCVSMARLQSRYNYNCNYVWYIPLMRPSSETIEAWRSMLQAHQRLTTLMDTNLRDRHGLRLDWYDVLYQLNAAGGQMRMHELAEAALFSRTDCTRIVDRMQRAGLVERSRAAEDGRGVNAVITADGRALLRTAAATHLHDIQRLFGAHVTAREATAMAEALGRAFEAAAGE